MAWRAACERFDVLLVNRIAAKAITNKRSLYGRVLRGGVRRDMGPRNISINEDYELKFGWILDLASLCNNEAEGRCHCRQST